MRPVSQVLTASEIYQKNVQIKSNVPDTASEALIFESLLHFTIIKFLQQKHCSKLNPKYKNRWELLSSRRCLGGEDLT